MSAALTTAGALLVSGVTILINDGAASRLAAHLGVAIFVAAAGALILSGLIRPGQPGGMLPLTAAALGLLSVDMGGLAWSLVQAASRGDPEYWAMTFLLVVAGQATLTLGYVALDPKRRLKLS